MKHRKSDDEPALDEMIALLNDALNERDEWMARAVLAEEALRIAAREIAKARLDAQAIPDFPLTVHSLN